MAVCFPRYEKKGLGLGLDLPWDGKTGFGTSQRGDHLAGGTRSFLQRYAADRSHAFFSWQPRDRSPPRLEDYARAWDDLFSVVPDGALRALHHTALNLAALGPYRRDELLAFTRSLCERYGFRWVNEDVGFWSLEGRAVPYPLPPLLTEEGLRATIGNVHACQDQLPVPLVLEFPGFSLGASVIAGAMHAYDFFRCLAEETHAPVTLDVGHLLSWQWCRGLRGEALFGDLERLPLEHCSELHLSGCEIVGEAFVDAHHGRLLDEQFALARSLIERCPNLRAVTYEDPRFDDAGVLLASNRRSWERLQALVRPWEGPVEEAPRARGGDKAVSGRRDEARGSQREAALGDYLFGRVPELVLEGVPTQGETAAVTAVHRMVLDRHYRGTGGLREWYPKTLAAWLEQRPEDTTLELFAARFCASEACASWREHPNARRGLSLEEALYRYFEAEGIGDAAVREDEMLGAVVRALAVSPAAGFVWPVQVRATATGCVALSRTSVLHAVTTGRYVRGEVTPLIAALLQEHSVADVATRFGIAQREVALVATQLQRQGLLAVESA